MLTLNKINFNNLNIFKSATIDNKFINQKPLFNNTSFKGNQLNNDVFEYSNKINPNDDTSINSNDSAYDDDDIIDDDILFPEVIL